MTWYRSMSWTRRVHAATLSILVFIGFQAFLLQSLWWWMNHSHAEPFGWRLGFTYVLFCIFISLASLLSGWIESPCRFARRWHGIEMSKLSDHGALTACNLLKELTQLTPGHKIDLFLIPGREINAFPYSLSEDFYHHQAIFVTRGALNQLNRIHLKTLLERELLQLKHPSCHKVTRLLLLAHGLGLFFCSGSALLRHANFGRFERRPHKQQGHPIFFIGIIPCILGLPGWLSVRLAMQWLNFDDIFEVDQTVASREESRRYLVELLQITQKFPHGDMPSSTWIMRMRGLHNDSFLESILPVQPSFEERCLRLSNSTMLKKAKM